MSTLALLDSKNRPRVVVTGAGVVSPLGNQTGNQPLGHTVEAFWQALMNGTNGIKPLSRFDYPELPCQFAGEIADFDPEVFPAEIALDKKAARRMDRFAQFALIAARQAVLQSGLKPALANGVMAPEEVAVIVGNGSGAIHSMEEQTMIGHTKGFRKITPFLIPMIIPDTASGHISVELGTRGPHFSMATACATGADCIGNALRMIQSGEVTCALAGGAEGAITPLGIAGFGNARALSTRNDSPQTASRPFDKDRDGFVMGEGACVLVLETLESALNRKAPILGEILGYGRTSDGYEVVSPHPEGLGSTRAMRLALKDAGLEPDAVGYINAHATSTPVGDVAESNAIVSVFGERASSGQLPVGSTKSMTGHMLGAAGAIEALIAMLAVAKQEVPPTINVFNQDPAIPLEVIAGTTGRKVSGLKVALSNSFGFFGHNASLVVGPSPV